MIANGNVEFTGRTDFNDLLAESVTVKHLVRRAPFDNDIRFFGHINNFNGKTLLPVVDLVLVGKHGIVTALIKAHIPTPLNHKTVMGKRHFKNCVSLRYDAVHAYEKHVVIVNACIAKILLKLDNLGFFLFKETHKSTS